MKAKGLGALGYLTALREGAVVRDIHGWYTPASQYPRERRGSAEVVNLWYRGIYESYKVAGADYCYFPKRTLVTGLKLNRKVVMVDDPWHWRSIQESARRIGPGKNVLVAGLGLGLIVHALADAGAKSVTVIEQSEAVIGLISAKLPMSLSVRLIQNDFYAWLDGGSAESGGYDAVFIDLWTTDDREETYRLFTTHVVPLALQLSASIGGPVYTLGFQGSEPIDTPPEFRSILRRLTPARL